MDRRDELIAEYRERCLTIKANREARKDAHDRAVAKKKEPDRLRKAVRDRDIAAANFGLAVAIFDGFLKDDRPNPPSIVASCWPDGPDYPVSPGPVKKYAEPNLLLCLAQAHEFRARLLQQAEPEKPSSAVVRKKEKVREVAAQTVRAAEKAAEDDAAKVAADVAVWREKWLK